MQRSKPWKKQRTYQRQTAEERESKADERRCLVRRKIGKFVKVEEDKVEREEEGVRKEERRKWKVRWIFNTTKES